MLSQPHIKQIIEAALNEDLAGKDDITSTLTIPEDNVAQALMRPRQPGIIAGTQIAALVFEMVEPELDIKIFKNDGDTLTPGEDILSVQGSARAILTAERTALNIITHLSGIATLTGQYVEAVKETKAKILDTRKTLPGLRALQKHAVEAGGGVNHRFGLYDAILIKDNHIAVAGGIKSALEAVKRQKGKMNIEIEVDTLAQLEEVLACEIADIVMLDNMDVARLKKAVTLIDDRIRTEASGGVTLDTVSPIAATGVDYISIGALTHSAPALDIGLDIDID